VRAIAIALLALAGCIDEFRGSNVQIDLSAPTPVQASPGVAPRAGELPDNVHFTLYAFSETTDATGVTIGRLFELQQFEIHRIVDLASPCFIDVGDHVPFPGLHVSQYEAQVKLATGIDDITMPGDATEEEKTDAATAIQRQRNVEALASDAGPKVLTSASVGGYPALAADCNDGSGIPPPSCTDEAANLRRLDTCRAAWGGDEELFEGTDRVLTVPLNGTTHGMVIGMNPVNLAPIGGAQFFVDEALEGFDGFAVYWQYDDANHDGQPDYPASVPAADRTPLGELLLFGRPEQPTRGVIHVHMTSLVSPLITAELAIFANLDEDDVHF
jgi:hypothetical protein